MTTDGTKYTELNSFQKFGSVPKFLSVFPLSGEIKVRLMRSGNLYRDVMTEEDREHPVGNIVSHLSTAQKRIPLRQTALFFKADPVWQTGWQRARDLT